MHNHTQAIVACDFFVVFTARFRILYVFVIMELGRRQILHHNATAPPSAEWTLQQFRESLTEEHCYRFLIHDRGSIFSKDLDQAVTAMGVRVLKTPVRAPLYSEGILEDAGWLPRALLLKAPSVRISASYLRFRSPASSVCGYKRRL